MKTFTKWAESNKLELPPVSENATKRAGIATWAYPDAYVRAQYPNLYYAPIAADHAQKLKGRKNEAAKNESVKRKTK